ncbi:MAG: hypothetical protein HC808_01275 [Candidatus Competibacteraceae bacterium]|nr:hypothetical protein [Candidatus Competibacteraceae bacterium]
MKLKITLDGVTYEVDVEFVDEASGAVAAPVGAKAAPVSTPQLQAAAKETCCRSTLFQWQ